MRITKFYYAPSTFRNTIIVHTHIGRKKSASTFVKDPVEDRWITITIPRGSIDMGIIQW